MARWFCDWMWLSLSASVISLLVFGVWRWRLVIRRCSVVLTTEMTDDFVVWTVRLVAVILHEMDPLLHAVFRLVVSTVYTYGYHSFY